MSYYWFYYIRITKIVEKTSKQLTFFNLVLIEPLAILEEYKVHVLLDISFVELFIICGICSSEVIRLIFFCLC